jgi:hypothetical protein
VSYESFLASKAAAAPLRGLKDVPPLSSHLFPHQRVTVAHNLLAGGCGCFLDTGLGKMVCELEYCEHARSATNGWALLMTPLAVTWQIHREGVRFGYPVRVIKDQSEAGEGINICNYERLHLLDASAFGVISLDESGIIKSFGGKTSTALIEAARPHQFKQSATATPAPNDHMELGTHSEFCGIMQSNEMLSRFFINDTSTASQHWRLKRYAVQPFWDWMASWARMAQMPSDMGFSDDGYVLPPMTVIRHKSNNAPVVSGGLFGDVVSATSMHEVKRQTAEGRARIAADLVTADREPWVIWVDTDYESDAVLEALHGVEGIVEVRGSMTPEHKERGIVGFGDGTYRVMVTKSSVCGFGLNWQHCARTAFVGRTFSYESWYQAVRRLWRFGQQREVQVHIAVAEGEETIGRVIDRKARDHADMKAAMRLAMQRDRGRESLVKVAYDPKFKARLPSWLNA